MEKQNMTFQAEVKEILNLMVHSLYSQREIFLRELISNASDALDKLRFEGLTNKEWGLGDEERAILLVPDAEARRLTIYDNGIGMSHDEVVKNIGTIAHSGTKEFLAAKRELKDSPELIGQFGVGFYSSFMVADRVVLHTQKVGETDGTLWESAGDGQYTISRVPRPEGHGTTIILNLKKFEDEDDVKDFTDEWTLRSIIKKYSDFISFPIKLRVEKRKAQDSEANAETRDEKSEKKTPETELVDEVVNSQKALWLRSPSEVKVEEYKEFYHHISHDWSEPFRTIHFKAEGTQEFAALMFIPKNVPFDYDYRDAKYGLNLYVRRVFIMDHCTDLQPHYLRFVRGMVDSSDLPLNVSREILQKDANVQKIQKAVVSKILNFLRDLMQKERGDYEEFWGKFGASLKEGLVTDSGNKEKISDLLMFRSSTAEGWRTLGDYVAAMKPEQKSIYYLSGGSEELLKNSPYLERLKNKGFEVLFITDNIDEWVSRELTEFKGKKFISIASDDLDIDSDEEKKNHEEEKKQAEEKFGGLKKEIQDALNEQVKEVRYSDRLVDSPVCLVSNSQDPSARMERMLEAMGQSAPKTKRILEINPKHRVFEKILKLPETSKNDWIEILYNQALLNEGSPLPDPAKFSRQIAELMAQSEI